MLPSHPRDHTPQGIKPSSFEKIDDAQTRELVEWCTRLNSKERPTVKQLLNHEFFAEDCGMRLEVANREEAISSSSSVIHLQLRVLDAKKRKDTHKENEAIQFNYVLSKDNPEETAKQMVRGAGAPGGRAMAFPGGSALTEYDI